MKPAERTSKRWVRAAVSLMAISFRAAPLRTSAVVGLTIVESSFDIVMAYLLKLLVDAAVEGDAVQAALSSGLIGGAFVLLLLAAVTGFMLLVGLQERTGHVIDRRIIELTAGLPGIEHHERPEYLDELILLRDQRGAVAEGLNAVVRNLSFLFRMAGTVALLAHLHPVLLLLPLFGIPSLAGGAKMQSLLVKAEEQVAEPRRLANHYFTLATTAAPAKELRLFGAGDEIDRRHTAILLANDRVMSSARLKGSLWYTAGWLVFAVGYVAAIAFVVQRAVNRELTIGDVVLAMTLAGRVNNDVANGIGMIQWLIQNMKTVGRYLWLMEYAGARPAADAPGAHVPERFSRGIDVQDVSFTYPGTEAPVLAGVNLHIPAGSTVAIVGDNGAGKSTLVKLLCRFYEPTAGRILVDGIDIATFGHDEWRARLAAGFQDFAKFELLAKEVVGVGDIARSDDEQVVATALERAHATDVVDGLLSGLDTQLGKSFDDGIELSGGQWQKLALGRAMMRDAPLLLVLDEPTAALDAQTEHALFERYAGAARDVARATGAITVFVSHRFSTVRMADLIVVVDGGRVVEFGSHEELTARGGLYAELYELQARQYR